MEVKVNREIREYYESVFFGLNLRQLIFSLLAIGAAVGTGERSVLVTGDGSFGMCLNELTTAVTYNVPVVILLMNNGVLGMVRQWQTLFFNKHYSNTILDRKTDFVALARAFGADGEAVDTVAARQGV